MDPLSQAAVGAAAAQAVAGRKRVLFAIVLGVISGMAADLDILLKSSVDPLMSLEYHRHFSHSLIFVPLGGFLVACLAYPIFKHFFSFHKIWFISTMGFVTHGLIDACTSYGTQLYWPFSNERVAWSVISVVDPIFTIVLICLISIAFKKKSFLFLSLPSIWIFVYLSLGAAQHWRAEDLSQRLAQNRGHSPEKLSVHPALGNLVLWRSVYEFQNKYFIDAIRLTTHNYVCDGTSIKKFDRNNHLINLRVGSTQFKDIERFRWFSNDYLGFVEKDSLISDVRYSFVPNQSDPLWGILVDPKKSDREHVVWVTKRQTNKHALTLFFQLLTGEQCRLFG